MTISFKCSESEFPKIEQFFFSQEYATKPDFDLVSLVVDDRKIYTYTVAKDFNFWHIVTK